MTRYCGAALVVNSFSDPEGIFQCSFGGRAISQTESTRTKLMESPGRLRDIPLGLGAVLPRGRRGAAALDR